MPDSPRCGNLGGDPEAIYALRDAINQGLIDGPDDFGGGQCAGCDREVMEMSMAINLNYSSFGHQRPSVMASCRMSGCHPGKQLSLVPTGSKLPPPAEYCQILQLD